MYTPNSTARELRDTNLFSFRDRTEGMNQYLPMEQAPLLFQAFKSYARQAYPGYTPIAIKTIVDSTALLALFTQHCLIGRSGAVTARPSRALTCSANAPQNDNTRRLAQ